jgi:4-amino-4-deoxy-L-arabinose transferase-like glycosyltransferase
MFKTDLVFWLLILCSLIPLIFLNLGNMYLWEDEAETAILAKNILEYGYPRAWDGNNLISHEGRDLTHGLVWAWLPWLQNYTIALSFKIFGSNTFTARFPFALIGFITVFLFYFFTLHLSEDKWLARLSTTILVVYVPFMLHIRQARYYALISLFTLLLLHSYLNILRKKEKAFIPFTLSAILLFHSNYLVFVGTYLGVILYHLILEWKEFNRSRFLRFVVANLVIVIFTLPWLIYADIFGKAREAEFGTRLLTMIYNVNHFLLPLILMPFVIYFFARRRYFIFERHYLLLFLIITCLLLLLSFTAYYFRYLLGIIFLFILFQSHLIQYLYQKNKIAGWMFGLILIFSNFFSAGPLWAVNILLGKPLANYLDVEQDRLNRKVRLKVPILDYLYEITHDYNGPNEGIVKFLSQHAEPGETIYTNFGHEVIIFYTGLKVVNRISDPATPFYYLTSQPVDSVDWIVIRKYWERPEAFNFLENSLPPNYKKYEINYPDLMWGNRPDPNYHKYRTVTGEEKVVIFHRISGN